MTVFEPAPGVLDLPFGVCPVSDDTSDRSS
jgi:hypothetical protein